MINKGNTGFTVIEIIFVSAVIGIASIIFFVQKHNLEVIARDDTKKIAINAMYYSLEEVFYPTNNYYPQSINSGNLKSVDPSLFTDPIGIALGSAGSAYSYVPTNCSNNQCKSYTLTATLEDESDFIKTNRNN